MLGCGFGVNFRVTLYKTIELRINTYTPLIIVRPA